MKDLITYLVRNIVKHPEDVVVTEQDLSNESSSLKHLIISIKVNDQDIPIVIGKGGRTIRAIRNISKIKAVKENTYVDVRVESEPLGSTDSETETSEDTE